MAGTWATISVPNTSTGTFNADFMILLTDGSVLVHNGFVTNIAFSNQWLRLTPDMSQSDPNQRYANGTWSPAIVMHNARQYFASGVMRDGNVFVIGGEISDDQPDSALGEIFDPRTNAWTQLAKPAAFNWVRGDCNGSILSDGRVLIGGATPSGPPSAWSARTALWDPSDNSWVEAGLQFGALATTSKTDPFEEESWALLRDGSVLAPAVRDAPNAERYVPSLDQWVPAAASSQNLSIITLNGVGVYETGGTITLADGRALAVGGGGNTALFTLGAGPTATGAWAAGPSFPADTSSAPVTPTLTAIDSPVCLLPSGKVVTLGGTTTLDSFGSYFSQNPVFLEYDPASSATTIPQLDAQPSLPAGTWTWQCWFLLLPTGQLMCGAQTNTLFIYTPDPASGAPDPAWKPANISAPATMSTGHSYTVSGTQINGMSQAVAYGDDGGMATNYPIVELTHTADGTVAYVRSHDFSTLGVATGTAVPADVQSCTIDIPPNMAAGDWNLVVIANGIRSDPVPVQIVTKDCFFIVENSTFSVGEVDSWLHQTPPVNAVFDPAFFVVVEGYTPAEMGLDPGMPIGPQLAAPPHVPNVPGPLAGMQVAFNGPMILEDASLPPTAQRFTFPFKITFTADSMFGASDVPVTLNTTFTGASGGPITSSASLLLSANPNPFILHGDQTLSPPEPWYLSQDLRVFQIVANPGAGMFEATLGTGSAETVATTFIQDVLANLRGDVGNARMAFESLHQDEDSEILALAPNDPATGHPVYNFAIAKVRYRDDAQPADNVRVFFRAWQAQQTNAVYDQSTTYARATNPDGQPIPVLGVIGDEIVSIPFFAEPRVHTNQHMSDQRDDHNRHAIANSPGETDYYFGCWLDVNQPEGRYPQRIVGVSSNGPFNTVSPLFPIQQFMRAAHQCLLAEIAYDPDHIPAAADPSTSDKLAQRNLAFGPAPNPGRPASRRVPQTFEIRPTGAKLPSGVHPDELMVVWHRMPAGATAEIYLPAARADAMLATADAVYSSHLLQRVDAHTVRFPARGVTYLPIPAGSAATYAALLTVDLPQHIRKGDVYEAVVRQVTGVRGGFEDVEAARKDPRSARVRTWRRTTGSFKLRIPVSTKELLLAREESYLAILKWIGESIHVSSRWHLVFKRFLEQVAGRVTFMGGDPGRIPASGNGFGPGAGRRHHGQHGRHGRDHDARFYAGKVVALVYDAFGDFTGFTLETNDGDEHAFESREHRMEELAERAMDERRRVAVVVREHARHRPIEFIVLE